MRDVEGKIAVITGAGSGIGRALAHRFASAGMRVALADVDEAAMARSAEQLLAAGLAEHDVLTQVTDVRREEAVDTLADRVYGEWGRVDVLVNNAGVFVGGVLWERPVADLEFVLGVNLWGILHGIRAFVPRMIAQGDEGHIVNTCSAAGLLATAFSGPYNISKFGALAATECLAMDLAMIGSPLKVTAVCPGMVQTDLAGGSVRTRPADLAVDTTPDAAFAMEALTSYLAEGVPAEDLAELVLQAILTEQFLVLTHEHHATDVMDRAERLAARQLPEPGEYR